MIRLLFLLAGGPEIMKQGFETSTRLWSSATQSIILAQKEIDTNWCLSS